MASEPIKHEERPPWCHDREHCHTRVVISNHGGTVFLHPFIGLVCVWVGRGCLASVLGMTFKLLQARYRPMPVLCTVSLNFLPQKVMDTSAPSLVPQCVCTGGVPRPTLAGADGGVGPAFMGVSCETRCPHDCRQPRPRHLRKIGWVRARRQTVYENTFM